MVNVMKIGLDIHGVIDSHRKFFSELTNVLKVMNEQHGANHEVHVMTGPRQQDLKPEELAGIWYTHIFSLTDYHVAKGTEVKWVKGNPYMEEYSWNRTKGDYAREHQLDLVIDDTLDYHHFFSTPVAWFQAKTDWLKKAEKGRL
jgi:hypothetical protein